MPNGSLWWKSQERLQVKYNHADFAFSLYLYYERWIYPIRTVLTFSLKWFHWRHGFSCNYSDEYQILHSAHPKTWIKYLLVGRNEFMRSPYNLKEIHLYFGRMAVFCEGEKHCTTSRLPWHFSHLLERRLWITLSFASSNNQWHPFVNLKTVLIGRKQALLMTLSVIQTQRIV